MLMQQQEAYGNEEDGGEYEDEQPQPEYDEEQAIGDGRDAY